MNKTHQDITTKLLTKEGFINRKTTYIHVELLLEMLKVNNNRFDSTKDMIDFVRGIMFLEQYK